MWRRWLTRSWWSYLLHPREQSPPWNSRFATVKCRASAHPEGEIYLNAGGLEPDHRCRNCGDVIG